MSMDVLDIERRQLFRQCGAHQRVAQRANAAARGNSSLPQQRVQQLPEAVTIGSEAAGRL